MARSSRGSLSAAHESDRQLSCRSMEEIYAADGGGSGLPYAQERVGHPALFHQLEKRIKAHVLVAFLGYALLVTLKHLLKRAASEDSPAKVLKRLSELYSVDIVLPTIEGREIWLRRISKLDEEQQKILHELQLQLPERLEPLQIQKCSENSAIA